MKYYHIIYKDSDVDSIHERIIIHNEEKPIICYWRQYENRPYENEDQPQWTKVIAYKRDEGKLTTIAQYIEEDSWDIEEIDSKRALMMLL